ncbi:glycosyltransferase [Jatrophihabitans telluris]|uniref:Glycosyltransferase n=1 Tax=Jatrophihabitans telluris TaxID=2038343 RepID=A0ABY4R344_9ACTN|nr:glycosyltransferase [Jatrophihabitans telluris]UQX90245.1 glycosyltransferase [Jatrophihabitans telluris]
MSTPTLGACLIVADETACLENALNSVADHVDEIVVVHTGVRAATVETAARYGATIVSAPWQQDFAAARNLALSFCRSEWVISLDADETVAALAGGPFGLRSTLAQLPETVTALAVPIGNSGGPDARGLAGHHELKLCRLGAVRWSGRVHERLVTETGSEPEFRLIPAEVLALVHHGYPDEETVRAKAARNAELARLQLADLEAAGAPPAAYAAALLDLGRSLLGSGRTPAAIECFEGVRALVRNGGCWLWATDFLARIALGQHRLDAAAGLIRQLSSRGADTEYCDFLRAQVLAERGELQAAASVAAGISRLTDVGGNVLASQALDALRAELAQALHAA